MKTKLNKTRFKSPKPIKRDEVRKKLEWNKNIILQDNGEVRDYELVSPKHTIRISMEKDKNQGFAGSNQVNVFTNDYGGWILDTPKTFRTKKEVYDFVSKAKEKLEKGQYGRMVAFPE